MSEKDMDFDFMYYQMETVDSIRKLDYTNPQDNDFMKKLYTLVKTYMNRKRVSKRSVSK